MQESNNSCVYKNFEHVSKINSLEIQNGKIFKPKSYQLYGDWIICKKNKWK